MGESKLIKGKFNIDLSWNLISFGVIAVVGLLINVLIVKFLDYETLGLFNQSLSFYLILSQLASFGIHLSIQRFIPELENEKERRGSLMGAVFVMVIVSIIMLSVAYFILSFSPLPNKTVNKAVIWVLPGVFFFALNKLLLSYLMGLRKMKAYAVLNTLRYVLMLLFLFVLIFIGENIVQLLTLSELVLAIVVFIYCRNELKFYGAKNLKIWIAKHFHFGRKSFWGNLLMDANSKVDIIVLGFFMENEIVGVYSFAAMFYEGFTQLFLVIRNNLNPVITKIFYKKGNQFLLRVLKRSIKKTYKYMSPLGVIGILGYPIILWGFGELEYLELSWGVFAILMLGNILFAGLIPLNSVFNQIGMPLRQTLFFSVYFLVNLFLNISFIPLIGAYGAAVALFIATSFSNGFIAIVLFKRKGLLR